MILSIISFDTISIALSFAILGFGVFISFKILNITDLTVEASYGFGSAICAMMCKNTMVLKFSKYYVILPYLALICAFLGGCFAGLITAILHTKFKINSVLSGILTLTMFYSINLIVIKGNASIGLSGNKGVVLFPDIDYLKMIIMFIFVIVIGILLSLFFKTRLGLSIRSCGDNEAMIKSCAISPNLMKIIGIVISNGLVALSGALFIQLQKSYSTNIEKGMMVVGVATIIIGEILTLYKHNVSLMLIGISLGSIVYRIIYAISLKIVSNTIYLNMISAILIIVILLISKAYNNYKNNKKLCNL